MWTLIFYVSVGFGTASTGGPAVIDNFASLEKCELAGYAVKQDIKQLDWFKCVKTK
jgi:hypothetical protein